MKACFKCGRWLSVEEFYPHKAMADGRLNKCKECTKRDVAARIERLQSDPAWWKKERARGREKYHRLGQRKLAPRKKAVIDPVKRRARTAVARAIRQGLLVRPDICERCPSSGPIEAHHADYTRPLEVEWVCVSCHGTEKRID